MIFNYPFIFALCDKLDKTLHQQLITAKLGGSSEFRDRDQQGHTEFTKVFSISLYGIFHFP